MRIRHKLAFAICVVSLAAIGATASEKKIKRSELPPAVEATVKEQSKGATILGFSTEIEHGKTLYEVELKVNGLGKDVSMDSSGTVLEVEQEVALVSIPAAAKQAIEKGAGKGKVLKVEAVSKGNGEVEAYEASVQKGGKKSEVRVDGEGKPKPEQD